MEQSGHEDTLTTEEVARLLGWKERTVRAHAKELGGQRPLNARSWTFTRAGIIAGAEVMGLNLPEGWTSSDSATCGPSNTSRQALC